MTQASAVNALPRHSVGWWLARVRLMRPLSVLSVGMLFALMLLLAAYLDGVFVLPFDPTLWRINLSGSVVTVYILFVYPILRRLHAAAMNAVTPLTGDAPAHATGSAAGEWLALALAAGIGLLFNQSVDMNAGRDVFWLRRFQVLTSCLAFGLTGWLIYFALSSTWFFAVRRPTVRYNVFSPLQMEPVANWSLGLALTFIGGITLHAIVDPSVQQAVQRRDVASMPVLALVLLVAIAVFFLNSLSAHRIMDETRRRELAAIQKHLATAYQDLQDRAARSLPPQEGQPASFIGQWLEMEKRVSAAPTWPYTSDTLRKLGASILLPIGLFILQLFISRLLQ